MRVTKLGSMSVLAGGSRRFCDFGFDAAAGRADPVECMRVAEAAIVATVTAREREVWALVALDYSDREISTKLGIAYSTVCNHRNALHRKLGTHSPVALAREAIRHGL